MASITVRRTRFPLAIDFGTSYTQAYYSSDGEPRPFPDPEVGPMRTAVAMVPKSSVASAPAAPDSNVGTPVGFGEGSHDVIIGEAALASFAGGQAATSFKKLFGRITSLLNVGGKAYTVRELSQLFFREFLRQFAQEKGLWPTRLVYTFPVTFLHSQRALLAESIEAAVADVTRDLRYADGSQVEPVKVALGMDEASAAAVANVVQQIIGGVDAPSRWSAPCTRTVLVCDVGGGTTDVALFEVTVGRKSMGNREIPTIRFHTKQTTGEYNFGGDVVSAVIVRELAQLLNEHAGWDILTSPNDRRPWADNFAILFLLAERIKHRLAAEGSVDIVSFAQQHAETLPRRGILQAHDSLIEAPVSADLSTLERRIRTVREAKSLSTPNPPATRQSSPPPPSAPPAPRPRGISQVIGNSHQAPIPVTASSPDRLILTRAMIEMHTEATVDNTVDLLNGTLRTHRVPAPDLVILAGGGAAWPQYHDRIVSRLLLDQPGSDTVLVRPPDIERLIAPYEPTIAKRSVALGAYWVYALRYAPLPPAIVEVSPVVVCAYDIGVFHAADPIVRRKKTLTPTSPPLSAGRPIPPEGLLGIVENCNFPEPLVIGRRMLGAKVPSPGDQFVFNLGNSFPDLRDLARELHQAVSQAEAFAENASAASQAASVIAEKSEVDRDQALCDSIHGYIAELRAVAARFEEEVRRPAAAVIADLASFGRDNTIDQFGEILERMSKACIDHAKVTESRFPGRVSKLWSADRLTKLQQLHQVLVRAGEDLTDCKRILVARKNEMWNTHISHDDFTKHLGTIEIALKPDEYDYKIEVAFRAAGRLIRAALDGPSTAFLAPASVWNEGTAILAKVLDAAPAAARGT